MNTMEWIDVPVAGMMESSALTSLLRQLDGDENKDNCVKEKSLFGFDATKSPKLWLNTAHAFGYIPNLQEDSSFVPIHYAGKVKADESLRNARVKISLGYLRIAEYPGSGNHNILFDFYAQNQVDGSMEHLHFNSIFRVRQGQRAPIIGFPIFVGLNVGHEGIALRCYTVNVSNEGDEKLLRFLDSDVFRSGLELMKSLQPAIAPLSKMALSLTQEVAKRNRNIPVQDFFMGLDFSQSGFAAHLREGSFVAVQIPDTFDSTWNWNDWLFDSSNGQIVQRGNTSKLIPYNYIVFNITKMK